MTGFESKAPSALIMKIIRNGTFSASTLIASLCSMSVICTLVSVIFTVTTNQSRAARRVAHRAVAISHGDAILEHLFDQWRLAMISVKTSDDRLNGLSTPTLAASLSAPDEEQLPTPAGLGLLNWQVVAASPLLQPTSRADQRPEPENGTRSRLRVRLHYL
ncbi:MAG: hypothetical protein M3463_21940, partial [Verrucomicrobiota bacterium]|nr:hypothetical protein [Verrucomicrobiota bacterium]